MLSLIFKSYLLCSAKAFMRTSAAALATKRLPLSRKYLVLMPVRKVQNKEEYSIRSDKMVSKGHGRLQTHSATHSE